MRDFPLDRISIVGSVRALTPQSENLFDIVTFPISQSKNFAPKLLVHGAFEFAIIFESENAKYVGLAPQFGTFERNTRIHWDDVMWWRCLSLRIAFFNFRKENPVAASWLENMCGRWRERHYSVLTCTPNLSKWRFKSQQKIKISADEESAFALHSTAVFHDFLCNIGCFIFAFPEKHFPCRSISTAQLPVRVHIFFLRSQTFSKVQYIIISGEIKWISYFCCGAKMR